MVSKNFSSAFCRVPFWTGRGRRGVCVKFINFFFFRVTGWFPLKCMSHVIYTFVGRLLRTVYFRVPYRGEVLKVKVMSVKSSRYFGCYNLMVIYAFVNMEDCFVLFIRVPHKSGKVLRRIENLAYCT